VAWVVELLDDRVREELDVLPADMKARFRRIVELIQDYALIGSASPMGRYPTMNRTRVDHFHNEWMKGPKYRHEY